MPRTIAYVCPIEEAALLLGGRFSRQTRTPLADDILRQMIWYRPTWLRAALEIG